jgi:hypothetical protein
MADKETRVIFLDMDGVLCTQRAHRAYAEQAFMQHLDPVAVRMLARLCKTTEAQLVLSSTWREFHDKSAMTCILMNAGFGIVPWHQNWCTPKLRNAQRGAEIQSWLEVHKPARYCILDDDSDMLDEQKPFFVQTPSNDGFLWEHYELAESILRRP